jgi:glycosyltransferase involved in cell wall biosynthesis
MHIFIVSLGRNILKDGSRERERIERYAAQVETLHVVVLTRREHGLNSEIHAGNLTLIPTNTRTRIGMLFKLWSIVKSKIAVLPRTQTIVSTQDPLEIGWFCYAMTRFLGIALHIQIHGDYFSSPAWASGSLLRKARRYAAGIFVRHVVSLRVVSERIKHSLIALGVRPERITVLPIRPELEQFLRIDTSKRTQASCTFLFLGRLAPEKNIQRIIHAFAQVVTTYPSARLRIVGDGEEKRTIQTLIHQLHLEQTVHCAPWSAHAPQEMGQAQVFLLASLHEAYALTLIEAMATGLPVITTDVGCVGEVVYDQKHGIVVYDATVDAYARAMVAMAADVALRERCGNAGRSTARELAKVSIDEYARAWVTAISKAS